MGGEPFVFYTDFCLFAFSSVQGPNKIFKQLLAFRVDMVDIPIVGTVLECIVFHSV